ncbi:hypothetical protein [Geomicrobium sediminis]|uniref:Uncharacterized protein n=1 Tax=Geomicrobium sediminis TaxID=1347788 RepID=A0ABS2P6S9_9BACL|nr:hypothetical protein [Geomicrobium sediminis]MBM7631098.1 hypothetical protein [Geomicrobium sediminis]
MLHHYTQKGVHPDVIMNADITLKAWYKASMAKDIEDDSSQNAQLKKMLGRG